MELFGMTVGRTKSLVPVPSRHSSWLSVIRESFSGAWQKGVEVMSQENLLAFSAVFACVSLISDDISKLRIRLMQLDPIDGIWQEEGSGSPFAPVMRKPNRYQTRIQFLSSWIISKLLHGNTYILKERDKRGVVIALYILDPRLVTVLVADSGDVYYQLNRDPLSELLVPVTIPASEIIHDRMMTLWHPLVGVSPISACGNSATQGLKIQSNSAKFFENMSRPSGQLTAPGPITDENAARLKKHFEENLSGENIGRLLVTGDGLKYEPMTIPANDAQLIEQLRWTVEDVARCFKVPLYKLGVGQPLTSNIGALNQDYYSQCLQSHIESLEILIDEGLALPSYLGTELELEGLLRMDPMSRADRNAKAIGAGYLSPNEARFSENLEPAEGGETPYLQQQNFSLAALAKRDAQKDPFAPAGGAPAPAADPALPVADVSLLSAPADAGSADDVGDEQVAKLAEILIAKFAVAENV